MEQISETHDKSNPVFDEITSPAIPEDFAVQSQSIEHGLDEDVVASVQTHVQDGMAERDARIREREEMRYQTTIRRRYLLAGLGSRALRRYR